MDMNIENQKTFYDKYWQNSNPIGIYKMERILCIIKFIIFDLNDIRRESKVLDFGCGNGSFVSFLNELVLEAHGFDISENTIKAAKKKYPSLHFLSGDGRNSTLKSNYYNIILSQEVIEHIIPPETYIKECSRILKSDGYLILTTPNKYYFDRVKGGNYSKQPIENLFTIDEIIKLLESEFSIIKVTTIIFAKGNYGIYKILHNRFIFRFFLFLIYLKLINHYY